MNIENRTTHNVLQGSDEWVSLRIGFSTASEAPSALGVSRYMTRNSLLAQKATGIAAEHDAATMARFARGHKAEQLARPIAEAIIGDDLSPVTMTATIGGIPMLASMDGMTFDGETIWENKLWNEDLARCVKNEALPEHYTVQMDQQLAVSGALRCLFTCSDGTQERTVSCWYKSDGTKLQRLVEGWMKFNHDRDSYQPEDKTQIHIGRSPDTMPALRIEVTGAVTSSNLSEFREHALMVIGGINRDLKSDADFVDAEQTVKWCAEAESRLKAAKDFALSQTESIEQAFRVIDDVAAEIRTTRLELAKLVNAEKDARREALVRDAQAQLIEHITTTNRALQADGAGHLPAPPAGLFAPCIKGLKSLDSMRDKLTSELLARKTDAGLQATRMHANRASLRTPEVDWIFLFADFAQVGTKEAEDFAALAALRITQHQQREAAKLEAERARIRAEEERRAREMAELEATAERVKAKQAAQAEAAKSGAALLQQAKEQAASLVQTARAIDREADTCETLTLGAINAMLSPIRIDAAGLAELGFEPSATVKAAKHYPAASVPAICQALIARLHHLLGVMAEA